MKINNIYLVIFLMLLTSTTLFSQNRYIEKKIKGNVVEENYIRIKRIKEIRITRYKYRQGEIKEGKVNELKKYNENGKLTFKEKMYPSKEVEIKKYDKDQRLIQNIEIAPSFKPQKTILSLEYSKDGKEVIAKTERWNGKVKNEKLKEYLIKEEGEIKGLSKKLRDTINNKSNPSENWMKKLERVEREVKTEKANISEYKILKNLKYKIHRDERSNIVKVEMYKGNMDKPYSSESFKYDENDNLLSEAYYNEKNKLIEKYDHSYKNDLLVSTENYNKKNKLKYVDKYEYLFYKK